MKPFITLEDGTRVLEITGDQQALEFGGGVVYRDRTGVFWSWWDPPAPGHKNYIVFTAALPRGFIDDMEVDLDEVALATAGELSARELKKLAKSRSANDRFIAMQAVIDALGSSSVCPEPDEVTPYEMALRWGEIFGVDREEVAMIDHEDYLIRETDRFIECGQVGGRMLGRFKIYEHALSAIADEIKRTGTTSSNVYHEHDVGRLELLVWDPERHAGLDYPKRSVLPQAIWQNEMRRYRKSLSGGRCKSKGIMKVRKQAQDRRRHKRMRQSAKNMRAILEARD